MAPLEQLDAYFLEHSYLGSEKGPTLEDYKQCKEIKPGSYDADKLACLARWHAHVSFLMDKYPEVDYRGLPVPAGKAPTLGGATGSKQDSPAAKEPKKDGKKDDKADHKKQAKKQDGNAAGDAEAPKDMGPEDLEKARQNKLKKVMKEGGKRGVEIEGAADMGGLQFFCTSVDTPEGDADLLVDCMKAMNATSDPADEERKGGSGHIGKMIFSAGVEQLAIVAYVPEAKQSELSCEEWIKKVLGLFGGELKSSAKDVCAGFVKVNSDKGVFPLKIREPMILEANNFLRSKGLFPEDDSDDDEMIFGDDDFPSI